MTDIRYNVWHQNRVARHHRRQAIRFRRFIKNSFVVALVCAAMWGFCAVTVWALL